MTWLAAVPGALRLVPRWAWYLLAAAAAWHFALAWHAGRVKAHDQAVTAARDAQWQARLAAERKAAEQWKARASAELRTISELQRKLNDEANRRIATDAGTLLVHGPGKAAAAACGRQGDPGGLPTAPGGPVAPAGAGSAAAASLPAGDRADALASVPWRWLVGTGQQCDIERAENLSWRTDYQQRAKEWEALKDGRNPPQR